MKTTILKQAFVALLMFGFATTYAQTTDPSTISQADADGPIIKLIDNKGTIKYLQSNNGITTITSTVAGNLTTTTWQLGGTLTESTYIDASGATFALDGIALETGAASTDATTGSTHSTATGTGWTLLVRDEATGETRKLMPSSLISGIRVEYTQASDASANVAIAVVGLPVLAPGTTDAKLFVYRNGAKLRSGTDFVATADTVTITYSADIPMYANDVIEIQYIK